MQTASQAATAAQAATLTATVDSMENATASTAAQTSTLPATVSTVTGTKDTRINAVLASLASTATVLRAAQVSGASTLTAAGNVQLTRVNVSLLAVNAGLAGKWSAASHIWIGSCSNYGK